MINLTEVQKYRIQAMLQSEELVTVSKVTD
jgi:hypothetical protein